MPKQGRTDVAAVDFGKDNVPASVLIESVMSQRISDIGVLRKAIRVNPTLAERPNRSLAANRGRPARDIAMTCLEIARRRKRCPGISDGPARGQRDSRQPAVTAVFVLERVRSPVGQHDRVDHGACLRVLGYPGNAEVGVHADRAKIHRVRLLSPGRIVNLIENLIAAVHNRQRVSTQRID